jgi:hypothetical protein
LNLSGVTLFHACADSTEINYPEGACGSGLIAARFSTLIADRLSDMVWVEKAIPHSTAGSSSYHRSFDFPRRVPWRNRGNPYSRS